MLSLKQPLSQEQKRLKVRDATRLLIEGEDFDYIRVKIRDTHGSTFNNAELEALAEQMSCMPADKLEALISDLGPCRRDKRHFQASRDAKAAQEARIAQASQNALNAREARKSREAKEAALMKNILAFVGFATIFLILNALLFWDNREIFGRGWDARVAEEVGKAGGVWALAYVMTWSARRNRHKWIFGVSILILFLLIFLQPNLLIGKMNVG